MQIQDIRRQRLSQLIRERYDNSQAKMVEDTGENQGEISGLLRTKSFGEKKARKLETKAGLPVGWMDSPDMPYHMASTSDAGVRPALVSIPTKTAAKANVSLVWADEDELKLLTAYRLATELGKSSIMTTAEVAEKNPSLLGGYQS
ncbi:hypothetical protein GM658_12460 [Pseudoduganella eburnea]|uniref:Uncharacterized protein n=1 Tax=Massilia eburnea TaxID=1776165 RepID=A0A6L6QGR3_9BURK|nr:hypothetical protein [Massilia eburnea]MTW11409.1 hypothetical protein [Massilia eburnea]